MTEIEKMAERLRTGAEMLADNLEAHEGLRLGHSAQLDKAWHANFPIEYNGNRTKDALLMQVRILRGLLLDIRDQLNLKEDVQ